MADFFSSGHALDLVLAFVALEILTLLVYRLRRRRNLLPADVLAHLCSAAALLVAARVTVAPGGGEAPDCGWRRHWPLIW